MARLGLLAMVPLLALLWGCDGSTQDAQPTTVYFLVAETEEWHGDSYVLPLTAAADIAHARALIAQGPQAGEPIVVARIAIGSGDGKHTNRDILGGGEAWSWHVAEFLGFADNTIEILDGWPGYVEQNLEDWLAQTDSEIGFWSYTVVRELSAAEVARR